jgi:hypothetical protein
VLCSKFWRTRSCAIVPFWCSPTSKTWCVHRSQCWRVSTSFIASQIVLQSLQARSLTSSRRLCLCTSRTVGPADPCVPVQGLSEGSERESCPILQAGPRYMHGVRRQRRRRWASCPCPAPACQRGSLRVQSLHKVPCHSKSDHVSMVISVLTMLLCCMFMCMLASHVPDLQHTALCPVRQGPVATCRLCTSFLAGTVCDVRPC